MHCRICGSKHTNYITHYHPYVDFGVDIYDCPECLSRFTPHDETMHEKLHSRPSTYASHVTQENKILSKIQRGDLKGARAFLEKREAIAFIISTLGNSHSVQKILEIGCSRGYLTAYFLATGKNVLGVDVSKTAVESAQESFGDHFCLTDDKRIVESGKYDAIFHVGTIGCVSYPNDLTRSLLDLLKPGGMLIFNAPNRMSCDLLEHNWISTPPPDLVTLFHPDFWKTQFSDVAEAEVRVLTAGRIMSGLSRSLASAEKKTSNHLFQMQNSGGNTFIKKVLRRLKLFALSYKGQLLPHDYGIHVILTKKSC